MVLPTACARLSGVGLAAPTAGLAEEARSLRDGLHCAQGPSERRLHQRAGPGEEGEPGFFPIAAASLHSMSNCTALLLFLFIFIYLALLGFSGGIQALSCSVWDLVP